MSNLIQVNLVAADREIWSGEATMVIAKTSEGEIGLLAGHEPMLAILIPGLNQSHDSRWRQSRGRD